MIFPNILVSKIMKTRFRELKRDAAGRTVSRQQTRNGNAIVTGRHSNEETAALVATLLNLASSHPFIHNTAISISCVLSGLGDTLGSSEPRLLPRERASLGMCEPEGGAWA